uniref:Uncharacterized protein n=1 Tax=Chromera velia CCMP2878 TaxID=1169474 RepID=A0A0G4G7A0_9ALVE|mmetsp:Transcript_38422/g.75433  ORF Transcript_38422/g.75433 Transcript_38422/m.75433 type:complete len:200 (-) Transcript_38422:935-1534(-)|eukprot:Cvel_4283.t1-p1 / transcript=Cvel_4283.t1 / gene=Cvel_4283 / organism=Chromera_velia_CCMP2878 / gene_product=hypothetical protein / transcript_product=hypothetical protein / location=Cvel_scaffold185:104151-104747(-) / protein_length=199 / sequence_SO=supercontig / SO=protein_coding / is_pseudo=false
MAVLRYFVAAVLGAVASFAGEAQESTPALRSLQQSRSSVVRQTLERAIRLGNFRVIFSRFNIQRDPFEYVCCNECESRFSSVTERAVDACNEKCIKDCGTAEADCAAFDNTYKVMLIQASCAGAKFVCGVGGVQVPTPQGTCSLVSEEDCRTFAVNNVGLCLRSVREGDYKSCSEEEFKQHYEWTVQWPCKFFARAPSS